MRKLPVPSQKRIPPASSLFGNGDERRCNMDTYFAVFNGRITERDRARRIFNKKFGGGSYRKYISPYIRRGIMSIFHDKPNRHTKFFVKTYAKIVNERLGDKE